MALSVQGACVARGFFSFRLPASGCRQSPPYHSKPGSRKLAAVSCLVSVRLDRALSKLGLASRAEAKRLIEAGSVSVGGRIVRDPGTLVIPERAAIAIDGQHTVAVAWRTIALHKPRGVVTTRRDPEGRRTVFDLIPDNRGLVTVGRLDVASTGLLLLTTDTQLAAWLTDPAHAIIRRYIVTARGAVTDADGRAMVEGIQGLRARSVEVLKRSTRETHLAIELTEGRNREIRRLLEGVGHEVTRLLRVSFGSIELGTLQPGTYREVTREEVARLRSQGELRRDRSRSRS
jgi:23S rRNA pseudouridine2605 synthase